MKIALLFVLFYSTFLLANPVPKLDPNKFTVCSMTMNSTDEREIYKKKMNPKDFNPMVELTTLGANDGFKNPQSWLAKACESGIQCDQLIISGHFAGSFFGDADDSIFLDLGDMERASCTQSCNGIFKNPKEVFLFGCNTLAGPGLKTRTPEEYLKVLREHHFEESYAESIVASSYGTLGESNKLRMQNVFGDNKRIYGFNSIAPSGKTVTPFWNSYLGKSDPSAHLTDVFNKDSVQMTNYLNPTLISSMKGTAFESCSGIPDNDTVKKNECLLRDPKASKKQKLFAIQNLLMEKDYNKFIPLINESIQEFSLSKNLTPEEKAILSDLSHNKVIREQLLGYAKDLKMLEPSVQCYRFLRDLGMITADEFAKGLKQKTDIYLAKPMSEIDQEIVCGDNINFSNNGDKVYSNSTGVNINNANYHSANGLYGLNCLGLINSKDVYSNIVNAYNQNDAVETKLARVNVLNNPQNYNDSKVVSYFVEAVKIETDDDERSKHVEFLSHTKLTPDSDGVMTTTLKSVNAPTDAKFMALNFYDRNKPLSIETKSHLKEVLQAKNLDPSIKTRITRLISE